MTKAHYSHHYEERHSLNFLLIIDRKTGPKTVTNDIENVIEEIVEKDGIELTNYVVLYRDTYGMWDGFDYFTETFQRVARTDVNVAMLRYYTKYGQPHLIAQTV